MYESSKGRYYIVRTYDNPGAEAKARFVSRQEAAAWLAANGYDLEAEGFGECAAHVLE
jgi:hypothetical protein